MDDLHHLLSDCCEVKPCGDHAPKNNGTIEKIAHMILMNKEHYLYLNIPKKKCCLMKNY